VVSYPLDTNTFTITWLQAWSEVRAYTWLDPLTSVEIWWIETSWTSFTFTHSSGGIDWYINIIALWYKAITLQITYSSTDVSIPIQQIMDVTYSNP
jgi:hypothetical protein